MPLPGKFPGDAHVREQENCSSDNTDNHEIGKNYWNDWNHNFLLEPFVLHIEKQTAF